MQSRLGPFPRQHSNHGIMHTTVCPGQVIYVPSGWCSVERTLSQAAMGIRGITAHRDGMSAVSAMAQQPHPTCPIPFALESTAWAVPKAAPDGPLPLARIQTPMSLTAYGSAASNTKAAPDGCPTPMSFNAYGSATNNTTATAEQTRRDRWKCGEQQTPPSQTLWRWCPCRRRRRRRGRDVPQRCWRCHLIQRRNALHHLDSCGARYCLVIIEPSALQQTSPDIHAAMMLELPLPPRVAQMPSHTSPDY